MISSRDRESRRERISKSERIVIMMAASKKRDSSGQAYGRINEESRRCEKMAGADEGHGGGAGGAGGAEGGVKVSLKSIRSGLISLMATSSRIHQSSLAERKNGS